MKLTQGGGVYMKSFPKGFPLRVREAIHYAQHGYCHNCEKFLMDYHHKVSNTTINRKLYPLFINSVFNCVGLCRKCHEDKPRGYKISYETAVIYEDYLRDLKNGIQGFLVTSEQS